MSIAKSLPALLASLVLGAHFLRVGNLLLVGVCALLAALCFVRRAPIPVIVRGALAFGVLEWVRTAWEIAQRRAVAGVPSTRAVLIVLGVAAFTGLAAWLLPGGSPTRRGSPEGDASGESTG